MKTIIHTLNARNNVMLEMMRDYDEFESSLMLAYIQGALTQTEQILMKKGIGYSNLKTALIPNTKKREVVLVFDSALIPDGWYGFSVHSKIIPLIPEDSNHSILAGDNVGNEQMRGMLSENIHLASNAKLEYQQSTQIYFVYFNNISEATIASFHAGLSQYTPYLGYVDLTYSSPLKTHISSILVNVCLKHRKLMIMGYGSDLDTEENVNVAGYPYEENGFICKSIPLSFFQLFLSYKIERPVFPGFESDTEFSLNAVNPTILPLSTLSIQVDSSKFNYLLKNKTGSLKRAGLIESTPDYLKILIQEKIQSNYIYNLSHYKEYGTTKFDILLEIQPMDSSDEIPPIRTMVALEYMPMDQNLRLITLY